MLALLSSALWGTADYLGGSISRRLPVLTVIATSQAAALIALLVAVPAAGGLLPPGRYVLWGVSYGLIGMVALAAFYRALATGTMGVVAPIAATGVVIPVLVALLADGERPQWQQYVGMGMALIGIVLASAAPGVTPEPGESSARRTGVESIALAVVAAIGFGTVFVLIDRGSETSVGMTLLAARASSILLLVAVVLLSRKPAGPWRPHWPMLAVIGVLDVSANGAFAFARGSTALSVVAVLGSLYPVTTVLLARHVDKERLSRAQAAGVITALVGVVLTATKIANSPPV